MKTEIKALSVLEQLRLDVELELESYVLVSVTNDDTFKEAKKQRASLNKLSTMVDTERKRLTKVLKSDVDNIISLIPIAVLDEQIKEYEEKLKETREVEIAKLYMELGFPEQVTLSQIKQPQWLNQTCDFETEMKYLADKVKRDMEILPLIASSQDEYDYYYACLELSEVKNFVEKKAAIAIERSVVEDDLPFAPIREIKNKFKIVIPEEKINIVLNYLKDAGVTFEPII